MKQARWVRGKSDARTVSYSLRSGARGRGQILWAVHYWPESRRSREAADDMCAEIEAKFRADGYQIHAEEMEHEDH